MSVTFQCEDTNFLPTHRRALRNWVIACAEQFGCQIGNIAYIFCSDDYLLEMNRKHLDHDYYTDIITFDYSEGALLSGDLFISIDRVRDNARSYKQPVANELHRVMIHGVLHLMGYDDKSPQAADEMRKLEECCLTLRSF